MSEHQYGFSTVPDEVERERLQEQEHEIDQVTIRHLEAIGVSKGWNCLEVGAGAGSIAQWLSSRVGSSGHVVAS